MLCRPLSKMLSEATSLVVAHPHASHHARILGYLGQNLKEYLL